jgi:23S rRNA pseudouridine2605 synthase
VENNKGEKIRLQKYIAQCGVASRRHAEKLISQGRVSVNGKTVTEMGTLVSADDRVEFDGKEIKKENRTVYIMLNKPFGYVTTVYDPQGRPTVLDLIEGVKERIYPVGRLDYDTTGLLILTNDGDFAYRNTHPSCEITKTYMAEVKGSPSVNSIKRLRKGALIDGRTTSPAHVEIIENKNTSTVLKIIIHEGRYHQVKRMCEAIGHSVIQLKRTAIGRLELGGLKPGQWRYLLPDELKLIAGGFNAKP